MAVRQQQRRGTASQWATANPILAAAEIGFEVDTNKFKIGDGTNRWEDLVYFTADAAQAIQDLIDGAPGVLDTLNELAASLGDNPDFIGTMTTSLAAKAPLASPTFTGTVSGVTKSHVGLGNVDNTSDANKPVSTATQTALDLKANTSAITELAQDAVNSAIVAGTGLDKTYDDAGNTITLDIDSTVATKTYADGAVSTAVSALTKSSVGLGNVTNTADMDKPVSTAQAAEIALKLSITTAEEIYAPLSSPALVNIPTAPTASTGTNTTQLATTAFVNASIANLVNLNLVLDGGGVA